MCVRYQVGWATLVGLAVMLMLGPMSGFLATKLGMLRRSMLQWTDKRVGYMNEVINGIQVSSLITHTQTHTHTRILNRQHW